MEANIIILSEVLNVSYDTPLAQSVYKSIWLRMLAAALERLRNRRALCVAQINSIRELARSHRLQ